MCLEDIYETFEYLVEYAEENVDDLTDYVERAYVHGMRVRGRKRPKASGFHRKLEMFIHQY